MIEKNDDQESHTPFQWLQRFCSKNAADKSIEIEEEFGDDCPLSAWKSAEKILGVDADTLTEKIANHFELEIATSPHKIEDELLHYVPRKVAEKYMVFPIAINNGQLTVASPHPFNRDMESMLEFLTTLHIKPQLASPALISKWIEMFYPEEALSQDDIIIKSSNAVTSKTEDNRVTADSAIVKIVSEMLLEAFIMKASDIHIEPYQGGGIVRYRIDGLLRVISDLPAPVFVPIVQRIKAISRLNLAKKMTT